MRSLIALIGLLFLLGCNQDFNGDTRQLQGYWEIEKVIMGGKVVKEFQVNLVVDYISLTNDSTGLRKKLAPKLDGTFANTKSAEAFVIRLEDDKIYLDYKTPYDSWTEQVLALKEDALITQNSDGIEYHYRKYQVKNIFPDE